MRVIGIDLGKESFHVVMVEASGAVLLRRAFGRKKLLDWLARQEPQDP